MRTADATPPTGRLIGPRFVCGLVTCLSVPLWFFFMIWMHSPIDNPALIGSYFSMCLLLAVPSALLNAIVFVPILFSRTSNLPQRLTSTAVRYSTPLLLIAAWHNGLIGTDKWITAFYLAFILVPPMLFGTLVACIHPPAPLNQLNQPKGISETTQEW